MTTRRTDGGSEVIAFVCRMLLFVVVFLAMKYLQAPEWAAVGIGLILAYQAFPSEQTP